MEIRLEKAVNFSEELSPQAQQLQRLISAVNSKESTFNLRMTQTKTVKLKMKEQKG